MSKLEDRLQNIDRRVNALEGDGIDDSAVLTRINKMYGDIEVEVTFRAYLHRYHMCGTRSRITSSSVTNTGAAGSVGGGEYTIFTSPDLLL